MSVKEVTNVDIEFFYQENKKEAEKVEYPASSSFVDGDGNIINWIIRPVSAEEDAMVKKLCTETNRDKRTGTITETFDDNKYLLGLTAKGIVFPDLNNGKLQSNYNVRSATALLQKMLTAGELQSLALKVIEVSGLDDIEGQKEENEFKTTLVKNN